jgi:hypothetical protein
MGLDRERPPGTQERLTGEPSPPCASEGTVAEGEDSALLPSGRGRKEGAEGSSSTRRGVVVVAWRKGEPETRRRGAGQGCSARLWSGSAWTKRVPAGFLVWAARAELAS